MFNFVLTLYNNHLNIDNMSEDRMNVGQLIEKLSKYPKDMNVSLYVNESHTFAEGIVTAFLVKGYGDIIVPDGFTGDADTIRKDLNDDPDGNEDKYGELYPVSSELVSAYGDMGPILCIGGGKGF